MRAAYARPRNASQRCGCRSRSAARGQARAGRGLGCLRQNTCSMPAATHACESRTNPRPPSDIGSFGNVNSPSAKLGPQSRNVERCLGAAPAHDLAPALGSIEYGGAQAKMASARQRSAARKNIESAQSAAKKKKTLRHLPKRTRTALGKQANKVKRRRRRR